MRGKYIYLFEFLNRNVERKDLDRDDEKDKEIIELDTSSRHPDCLMVNYMTLRHRLP